MSERLPRSVNLRLWLPMSLLGFGVLLMLLLLMMQLRSYQRDLEQFKHQIVHEELLRTQRGLETAIRRNDGAGLDHIMAELGLNPAVNFAALWNEHGWIIAATQFAWKGQRAEDRIPNYSRLAIGQWQQLWQESLTLDAEYQHLTALGPVLLDLRRGELRPSRQGVLLISYDLAPRSAISWQVIKTQTLIFAIVLLIGAFGLYWFAQWAVLRPAAVLRAAMIRIGGGDFANVANLSGHGEFKLLDIELGRMADELQENRQALAESEARFRQLSNASTEGIVFHEQGIVVDANLKAEQMLGMTRAELVGASLLSLVADAYLDITRQRMESGMEGTWELEVKAATGELIPVDISARQQKFGGRTLRVVAARDIRDRLAAEATIRQLSQFDVLTGLPNRRLLIEQVQAEVSEGEAQDKRAALAAFNLNMFKSINDSMGMAAGDSVLKQVAKRLSVELKSGQFLARVVGDTFALLMTDINGSLEQASAQAEAQLEQLLKVIEWPLEVAGQILHLSAGAGIVMIPNDSRDAPELLREAETAMHQAKRQGNGHIHFFAHALQEVASARLALRNDLRLMLDSSDEQLVVFYQPQVSFDGALLGVEALARWRHPVRGLIPPFEFIGEAESCGLIVPLGREVFCQAARALKRWQQANYSWAQQLIMAVNVSPRQFQEADFVEGIKQVLVDTGVSAQCFELELTESVVADDLAATLDKMEQLKQLGVRFALDDFGTGYSSLSYLKRLPIDTLKIDRSFVMDIDAPEQERSGKRPAVLIDAIIAMSHQLDLKVLAEGVETQAQRDRLQQAGCDIYQGYYYSRPMPEEALVAWAKH